MKKVKLLLKEENIEYSKDKIKNAIDVIEFLNKIENANLLPQESAFILCINTKNEVVAYSEVARGGVNSCYIDLKTIFKTVLLSNASKFIMVHNHPSGDPTPSKQDIRLTETIMNASKIMDIEFLDHLVIGGNRFASCMQGRSE